MLKGKEKTANGKFLREKETLIIQHLFRLLSRCLIAIN